VFDKVRKLLILKEKPPVTALSKNHPDRLNNRANVFILKDFSTLSTFESVMTDVTDPITTPHINPF